MIWIDHVIYAVQDVEAAAERFRREFGLVARPGGVHPGGTSNYIVELEPPQYFELLTAADRELMRTTVRGRWLLGQIERGDCFAGWAVGTDDIEAVAARARRPIANGSISRGGRTVGSWRIVRPDTAYAASLPFFIQYEGDADARRARQWQSYRDAVSPAQPRGVAWVEVAGDPATMRTWLASDDLPIRIVDAPPGLRAVGIDGADGEIVIR